MGAVSIRNTCACIYHQYVVSSTQIGGELEIGSVGACGTAINFTPVGPWPRPSQITRPRRRKSHVICEGRLLLRAHTEIAYSFTKIRVNYN